jgi:hypothetical protein
MTELDHYRERWLVPDSRRLKAGTKVVAIPVPTDIEQ